MKRLVMAMALTCALSASSLGNDGDIPSGGLKAPVPGESTTTIVAASGEIPSSGCVEVDIVLTLVQLALGGVV